MLLIIAREPALRARHHGQLLFFGYFRCRHEALQTVGIGAERLLAEDMLVGVDGRFEMLGTIARRRGEHHDVNIGGNQLLERIETNKALFGSHFNAVFPLLVSGLGFEVAQRPFQFVFKEVGNGDQFHVLGSGHQVDHGLRAAWPAPTRPARRRSFPAPRTSSGFTITKADAAVAGIA